jgi:hypothetical protein
MAMLNVARFDADITKFPKSDLIPLRILVWVSTGELDTSVRNVLPKERN